MFKAAARKTKGHLWKLGGVSFEPFLIYFQHHKMLPRRRILLISL